MILVSTTAHYTVQSISTGDHFLVVRARVVKPQHYNTWDQCFLTLVGMSSLFWSLSMSGTFNKF